MDAVKEFGGELAALALDAVALAVCLRHLLKWRAVLRDLRNAPVLDLDGDLEAEVRSRPGGTVEYAAVRGLVRPKGEAIAVDDLNARGVVKRLTVKEHVVARSVSGFWSDETRTVHETLNAVPFLLVGDGVAVEILDALDAEALDMDVVADRFEPVAPSLLDHIWGYVSGVRRRGLQTTEEMLKEGAHITAVGELSARGGLLRLRPPERGSPLFLIASTKNGLIKKIGDSQNLLRILVLVFGATAIALTARIAYKYIRRKNDKKKARELKERTAIARRQRRELGREKNLTDAQLCVVCVENPKEIILLPCGHVSLCENCSDNVGATCPVCRTPIESRAPAFIT